MVQLRSQLNGVTDRVKGVADRDRWSAHGASLLAKVKATKAVWFPPDVAEDGRKTAGTAGRATRSTTKRAAKKTAKRPAKKATRKSTSTARKAAKRPAKKTA